MNRKLLGIALAAMFMAICHGAETMAYYFAGEPVLPTRVSDCPLLKAAPAATPFVAAGDELRDLTEVLRKAKVPLVSGWAVWNQTKRLLVVHGSTLDLWRSEEVTEFPYQPLHAKLTASWIQSEKPQNSPAERDHAFASVTVSGEFRTPVDKFIQGESVRNGWSFELDALPMDETGCLIASYLNLTWKGPAGEDEQLGYISTACEIRDGQPLPLASWYLANRGPAWQITIKAEKLLADGFAWRDARSRQDGDKIQVFADPSRLDYQPVFLALPESGDRKVYCAKFLLSEISDPQPDLPEVEIPAGLRHALSGTLLDLRPVLGKFDLKWRDGDFIAYDPLVGRILLCCGDDQTTEAIMSLFSAGCYRKSLFVESAVWLADAAAPDSVLARISLVGQSGGRASFDLEDANEQSIASFVTEPTMGEGNGFLKLRQELRCDLLQSKFSWHSNSSLTVPDGMPIRMNAAKLPNGKVIRQSFRATRME